MHRRSGWCISRPAFCPSFDVPSRLRLPTEFDLHPNTTPEARKCYIAILFPKKQLHFEIYHLTYYKGMDDRSKFSDSIAPLWSGVLDAPPSCLEFVPRKHNPGLKYFIVGTYTLLASENQTVETKNQEDPSEQDIQPARKHQEKVGSLKLFRVDNGSV